jgi:hypothetical protein
MKYTSTIFNGEITDVQGGDVTGKFLDVIANELKGSYEEEGVIKDVFNVLQSNFHNPAVASNQFLKKEMKKQNKNADSYHISASNILSEISKSANTIASNGVFLKSVNSWVVAMSQYMGQRNRVMASRLQSSNDSTSLSNNLYTIIDVTNTVLKSLSHPKRKLPTEDEMSMIVNALKNGINFLREEYRLSEKNGLRDHELGKFMPILEELTQVTNFINNKQDWSETINGINEKVQYSRAQLRHFLFTVSQLDKSDLEQQSLKRQLASNVGALSMYSRMQKIAFHDVESYKRYLDYTNALEFSSMEEFKKLDDFIDNRNNINSESFLGESNRNSFINLEESTLFKGNSFKEEKKEESMDYMQARTRKTQAKIDPNKRKEIENKDYTDNTLARLLYEKEVTSYVMAQSSNKSFSSEDCNDVIRELVQRHNNLHQNCFDNTCERLFNTNMDNLITTWEKQEALADIVNAIREISSVSGEAYWTENNKSSLQNALIQIKTAATDVNNELTNLQICKGWNQDNEIIRFIENSKEQMLKEYPIKELTVFLLNKAENIKHTNQKRYFYEQQFNNASRRLAQLSGGKGVIIQDSDERQSVAAHEATKYHLDNTVQFMLSALTLNADLMTGLHEYDQIYTLALQHNEGIAQKLEDTSKTLSDINDLNEELKIETQILKNKHQESIKLDEQFFNKMLDNITNFRETHNIDTLNTQIEKLDIAIKQTDKVHLDSEGSNQDIQNLIKEAGQIKATYEQYRELIGLYKKILTDIKEYKDTKEIQNQGLSSTIENVISKVHEESLHIQLLENKVEELQTKVMELETQIKAMQAAVKAIREQAIQQELILRQEIAELQDKLANTENIHGMPIEPVIMQGPIAGNLLDVNEDFQHGRAQQIPGNMMEQAAIQMRDNMKNNNNPKYRALDFMVTYCREKDTVTEGVAKKIIEMGLQRRAYGNNGRTHAGAAFVTYLNDDNNGKNLRKKFFPKKENVTYTDLVSYCDKNHEDLYKGNQNALYNIYKINNTGNIVQEKVDEVLNNS